ncbi:MAG: radical SAM protein [Spirochaetales bacterium]|nr:radical SAM protein [Spirochaetales bacterium]
MSLRKSKHTICAPVKDSDSWYILNLLSGEADILEKEMAEAFNTDSLADPGPFLEKGYYMDEKKETALFNSAYLDFVDQQDDAEVQVFYVPDYFCNFKCNYCYQEEYGKSTAPRDQKKIMDAFFSYLDANFTDRPYYLTLFGGEPLLTSKAHKENIHYFLDRADERGLSLAIVTNGYTLEEYLPRLKNSRIREIQITLDGPAQLHDIRRPLRGGQGTFDRVSDAVDLTLNAGIPVNLRAVMDKQNIDGLPDLAAHAVNRGWTQNPLFKTQLGRNYELHSCQKDHEFLFTRIGMYERIYELIKEHPQILEFHRPAFSLSRFLADEGELPEPLFDSCPGAKTEWAFDYSGNIYSCTATVGKAGEELGQFYPEVTLNEETVEMWQDRDVCSIKECRECSLQLACGGGCAAVAKNRTGYVMSSDCRPVDQLMTLGLATYFQDDEE